jgi:hypothetical protein
VASVTGTETIEYYPLIVQVDNVPAESEALVASICGDHQGMQTGTAVSEDFKDALLDALKDEDVKKAIKEIK